MAEDNGCWFTACEQAEQTSTHIVWSQGNMSNTIDDGIAIHLPVGYEALTYELTGLTPNRQLFFLSEIKNGFEGRRHYCLSIPARGRTAGKAVDRAGSYGVFKKMTRAGHSTWA